MIDPNAIYSATVIRPDEHGPPLLQLGDTRLDSSESADAQLIAEQLSKVNAVLILSEKGQAGPISNLLKALNPQHQAQILSSFTATYVACPSVNCSNRL